jgi:pyrroloquinoline-quinone synthase
LVVHYGLPLQHLALTKAHRGVEGQHRLAAWRIVLDFVGEAARPAVVDAMRRALSGWLEYRDDVAAACGIPRVH